jgi:acarbose 7IV-phosphotransferase
MSANHTPSWVPDAALEVPAPAVDDAAGARAEVLVIGNIGIDTNVYLPPGYAPASREGAFTDNVDFIGQAGGYCAFGFAALGRKTGFVGYVGDDPLGHWIEAELERAGIERLLSIDPAGTSRSVNLMGEDGRRSYLYDGKSHMVLEPNVERCLRFAEGARLAHVHLPNWARRLLPGLRRAGCRISVDLQDLLDVDDPYRQDFIAAADIVFYSASHVAAEGVAQALLTRRPELVVVVGMGAQGAALASRELGFRVFPPVAHPRPIVDTNGAGDSLAVGFLTAFVLEGRPPEEALRWGQLAARHTCTLRGGYDSLITREALVKGLG